MTGFRYPLWLGGLAALTIAVVACAPQPGPEHPDPDPLPGFVAPDDEATACAACHDLQVSEWRLSAHARSTAAHSGLYRLLRREAVRHLGDEAHARCSECHYADPTLGGVSAPATELEPVTCRVCHDVPASHDSHTGEEERPLAIRSTLTARNTQELCLTCHAGRDARRALCGPGLEAKPLPACASCHMPAEQPHRMPGAGDYLFIRQAATVSLALRRGEESRDVVAVVDAGQIGHPLPAGNSLREVRLILRYYNASGEIIWQNLGEDAALPDAEEAVFRYRARDAEGKTVAPFAAQGEASDTRLEPGETRLIAYPVPEGATMAEAELLLRLAPPELLEEAGFPPLQRRPRRIARDTLTLP